MIRFSLRPNRAHLIHWQEWSETAFTEAAEQDRPVMLFIGAFWCGICQRMDETSFSQDEVIAMLNAYFTCIRVEESQRPDIDLRYNLNGWPTIVFLTPAGGLLLSTNALDSEPFLDLLLRIVEAWQRREELDPGAAEQQAPDSAAGAVYEEPGPLGPEIVAEIAGMVEGLADGEYGGFGTGDKLIHAEATEFLLYLYEATGRKWYLDHALLTLRSMRASRLYDSKDGGFFRYSSRRDWQEPHPEKLLDDQAALLRNCLHAYVLTGDNDLRATAESLIDYLDTTLLDTTHGVFSGCQDYVRELPEGASLRSVIDTCIYCEANAQTASAYLDAWLLLGGTELVARARHTLEWLWEHLRAPDGGMYHFWDGSPDVSGLLMDSVAAGQALLDGYRFLGDAPYLEQASELADFILAAHRSDEGGFFDIKERGPAALHVPMTVLSQNAATAAFFLLLADLTGQARYRDAARWALKPFPGSHRRYGAFAAGFGHALAQLLAEPELLTISGRPGDADVRGLIREALTALTSRRPVFRFRDRDTMQAD